MRLDDLVSLELYRTRVFQARPARQTLLRVFWLRTRTCFQPCSVFFSALTVVRYVYYYAIWVGIGGHWPVSKPRVLGCSSIKAYRQSDPVFERMSHGPYDIFRLMLTI